MREEKLETIRKEIKKLTNARNKYIDRKKRMEQLAEDPKVQEYIKLTQEQEKSDKFIKNLESDVTKAESDKKIREYIFKKGIEKIPLDETNGIYIYQGVRKMGDRTYHKYHNLEKERSTFILEENNEEFKKNNTIINQMLKRTPEQEQQIVEDFQNIFFEVMYKDGQEEAKKYMKTKFSNIIIK